jgi:hypothetical protein
MERFEDLYLEKTGNTFGEEEFVKVSIAREYSRSM